MKFGLIIIGDEIVQGDRVDAHFQAIKAMLAERGLRLAWVEYVCDDRADLVARLQRSFAGAHPVLVTGGIGATPDDHTRQAAALALGRPLVAHAEAIDLIDQAAMRLGETQLESTVHQQRREMGHFAQGADIIPNPYNGIAGFSVHQHYFVPGFPVMAHPMLAWVLDTYFAEHFHQNQFAQQSGWVYDLQESQLAPVMLAIEQEFAGIQTFSLPILHTDAVSDESSGANSSTNSGATRRRYLVELGVKAEGGAVAKLPDAWARMCALVGELGSELHDQRD